MRPSPWVQGLLRGCALVCVALLVLIAVFLVARSSAFLAAEGALGLVRDDGWLPSAGQFNLVPMLVGTLLIAAGAVALAAPIGILLALFGRYVCAPRWRPLYRATVDLLAGIPSVVYGLWGLIMLVPLLAAWVPPGVSVLAGILVLAVMILPLMVIAADNAFGQVPAEWLRAGEAMALSRWGMVRRVILPATFPALRTGAMLQSGRALGETMAVLMVCGNVIQFPGSVFDPARTLTANIALEMAYATGTHAQALMVCGLVLLLMTVLLVFAAGRATSSEHPHG